VLVLKRLISSACPPALIVLQGGKMKKYNYNFIIHLLLNKYGWTQEEIGAWTWKKTNGS
jgi:hypothetical protein